MKRFSKLIPAIVLLLVSAIMMSTATYAWFSMNNRVTVTGMEVKTKVSSNLLIAETNDEDEYTVVLSQTQKGLLEPVSTVDAASFFYTTSAKATGEKVDSSAYTAYDASVAATNSSAYGNKFSEAYNVTKSDATAVNSAVDKAVAYVDYVFYLKATNSESTSQAVKMTRCNILYDNAALAGDSAAGKAWRIAVFAQKVAEGADGSGDGTLVTILGLDGAAYFTGSSAVNSTSSTGTVSNLSTAANIDTELTAGATQRYKVVIRLWLEGEDTSCNNETYAKLTNAWKVDLAFELGTANPAVTAISSNIE